MPKPILTCHMCRSKVTGENFCHGCKIHICEVCDRTLCLGEHLPIHHVTPSASGEYHGE